MKKLIAKEDANYRFKALVNPVILDLKYSKLHPDKVQTVVVGDDNGKVWQVGIDSFYRHFIIKPVQCECESCEKYRRG